MESSITGHAVFTSSGREYHADTCDLLQSAAERGEVRLNAFGRNGYPGARLQETVLPGVSSLGCWDASRHQSWGLGWHRNEGIELSYLAGGRLNFGVDAEEFSLASGHLTITRPWQKHRLGKPLVQASRLHWAIVDVKVRRPNEPWCWPDWLVFSPTDLHRLTTLLRQCERPVWNTTPAIRDIFEAIARELKASLPARVETRLKILLNGLLLEVLQLLESKQLTLEPHLASTRRTVELFLSHLPEHVEYPWTLESMAKECGLGRSRFAHFCQEITNLTPLKYLEHCRLQSAQRLLSERPESQITTVALACGFSSSQYFANVFRRAFGLSPSAWRRAAKARTASPPCLTIIQTRRIPI